MMKKKIRLNTNLLIVIVLAVIFFIMTSSFNFLTQSNDYVKWNSPDETANYFFAKRFSLNQDLAFFDESAIIGDNMVMPRSFRSDFGWLKPVSFLGIILIYGSLGSIFGTAIIPFITPFLASLGIIFFYLLVSRIFSKKIGLISAFLLTFFPVYIYYSLRSMFHNVLYVVLLIFSAYLLSLAISKRKQKTVLKKSEFQLEKNEEFSGDTEESAENTETEKKYRFKKFFILKLTKKTWLKLGSAFLAGIFIGLAISVRASEMLWLVPALFLVWIFYAKRYSFTKLVLIVSGIVLGMLPSLYYNQILYNSPFYGGYNEMNKSLNDIASAGSQIVGSVFSKQDIISHLKLIYHNIFYFGFKPYQSLQMAGHYIWEMFPYLSIAFILGVIIILITSFKKYKKKYLVYFLVFLSISLTLIFYYGSWKFNDNPDPTRHTIGNSYTRYWLPIYLMLIPPAGLFIYNLSRALALAIKDRGGEIRHILIKTIQALIISLFIYTSLNFVLFGSEEGLYQLYLNAQREKANTEKVFSLSEENSIIITKYYDKFLFPERRIIMGNITDTHVLKTASKLEKYYPVYYYNFNLRPEDITYLNERKLPDYNLSIALIERVNKDFSLYSLDGVVATSTDKELE